MKTTFRFQKIPSKLFGHIYRPYAQVMVYGKNRRTRAITMLVDTGADFTIFPRREAAILGIDLNQDCTMITTNGVGGPQRTYLYHGLEVELGDTRLSIPVGFLDRNNVSPLMGRQQFMELFRTCFHDGSVSFES